jgi:hypothetical protein
MAEFSVGEAMTAGFRLIARRPGAVLCWGLVYLLVAMLPQVAIYWPHMSDLIGVYRETIAAAQAGGPQPTPTPALLRLETDLARYQPLQMALSVVGLAIVNSAIYRAVLEPEDRAFASIRLGVRELWVGLAVIVFYALVVVVLLGSAIPVVATSAVAGAAPSWGAGLMVFLAGCGAIATVIWVCLRLSLALPMSFDQKSLRLIEAWPLTLGMGWKLFGMAVVLAVTVAMAQLGVMIIVAMLVGGAVNLEAAQAFFAHPPADAVARAAPWALGGAALYVVITGFAFTVMTAPFAEIYRLVSKPRPKL